MSLRWNSSVNNFYTNSCEKTAFWQQVTSQKWACIFTSNCLQKTMSFLVYRVFKSRNPFGILKKWLKKKSRLSWMWSVWPGGTARNVKTKQNPSTFNKYLCTQCYIHVLYISTQEWVWIVASYFFAENTKLCHCYCSQMHGGCEEILFFLWKK